MESVEFKFRWLDAAGRESGFLSKKGRFQNDTLFLDQLELPVGAILDLTSRENRLVITFPTTTGEFKVVAIAVYGMSPKKLKAAMDIARSATFAMGHKKELEKKGQSHHYREETCPQCQATLVLSRMPRTPQLYCYFCDSLTTTDGSAREPAEERDLKICEECGMFSKPRKFTIFYFYFLILVYGWQQRVTWRCPACMRGEAWKMFFGNLVFLLGVPVAIVQLIRSYGGAISRGPYAGLDRANIKARKGDFKTAIGQYRLIMNNIQHSAGIKYNIGVALRDKQPQLAAETFEGSLKDCANYTPTFNALLQCYQAQGETGKLAALKQMWGIDEKTPAENLAAPPLIERENSQ